MNFEMLYEYMEQNRYDEVQMIGKYAFLQGKLCYFIAVIRQDTKMRLLLLTQAALPEEPKKRRAGTMRQSLRDAARDHTDLSLVQIRKIKIGDLEFQSIEASSGSLHADDHEHLLLLADLVRAGWRMEKHSAFFQKEWNGLELEFADCKFECPSGKLPQLGQAQIFLTWDDRVDNYLVEKKINLQVGDHAAQSVAFPYTDADGNRQEAQCYIARVFLTDLYQEQEERFHDPEYVKRLQEYMTPEEIEQNKKQVLELLEQNCPRGMCFAIVEYECTGNLTLDFYTCEYLSARQKTAKGSASFMLFHSRPDQENGVHGLRLRHSVMQTPVAPDTLEIQAELFCAREQTALSAERVEFS